MIELLIEAGADANAASPDGETPLMVAARTGKVDAVRALLAHGANPNTAESWRGQTALMWAAAEGHAAVIPSWWPPAPTCTRARAGASRRSCSRRVNGRIPTVGALLTAGAQIDDALPVARRGADANASEGATGANAFLLAAGNAHYELAAWLLDRGADPNAAPQGYTALHQVSWVRKAGIAGSNNPAPEGSGNLDSLTFVRKLVSKGAKLERARDQDRPDGRDDAQFHRRHAVPARGAYRRRTADEAARRAGRRPAPRQRGRLDAADGGGRPGDQRPWRGPRHRARGAGSGEAGARRSGNDINAVDKNGETAMHGAAYKHVPSVVRYLAEKGARMEVWNAPNKKGWTPLRIADGVHRGMNIVSSPVTAATIRQVMVACIAGCTGR